MARVTMIELEIPQGKTAFPVEQADALLRMQFNGGWKLPEDSEWSWTPEKGFEKKEGKKSQPKSAASKGDNAGENASEMHDNA